MLGSNAAILVLTWSLAAAAGSAAPKRAQPALDESHVWSTGGSDGFELVRGKKLDSIRKDASEVVRAINTVLVRMAAPQNGGPGAKPEDEPPTIRLIRIRGGIATVEVLGAECLTQGMGTTGAYGWLAAATFTLTEIPGVKAVDFRFEEGDHAAPGLFRRARFLGEFRIVRD